MSRHVFCKKLNIEAEGLAEPPYPTALGQKIFDHISAQAWNSWIAHQTMLINEYKLSLIDKQSRDFLMKELEKFLFKDEEKIPQGYIPIE